MLTINGKRILTPEQAVVLLFGIAICDKMLIEALAGFLGSSGRWAFYITEGLLLVLAIPAFWRTVQKLDIIAIFGWSLLLLVNVLLLRREQEEYQTRLVNVFLKCFPLYFVGKAAANYMDRGGIKCLQWIVVLGSSLYTITMLMNGLEYTNGSYSQYMGYTLLPPACLALCFSLKGKLIQIPFAVLLLYGIIASGARGPLLSMLLAGAVYVIGRMNSFSVKKFVGLTVVGVIAVVVCLNFETLLELLFHFFESNGISVRVLRSLMQGTFTDDNGRLSSGCGHIS